MKDINWKLSKRDQEIVAAIAKRALPLLRRAGHELSAQHVEMDVIATHRIIGLRLLDLAATDDANFGHDLLGIVRYLDRETLEMKDFFIPRFAARKKGDWTPPASQVAKQEEAAA